MRIKYILIILLGLFLFLPDYAQTGEGYQQAVKITEIEGRAPAETAHIVKYFVDKAEPGSDYETENLHIIYSDGTEIIERVPPKKSSEENSVFNQEGITDLEVAEDKRTIGWTETYDNCCTSYSIPAGLAVYQSGKRVLHIQQGQVVWYWMFLDGGKRIAVVWGATHGAEIGDYQLYEVKTGRLISEVSGDADIQRLAPNAPKWARMVEEKMHKRK